MKSEGKDLSGTWHLVVDSSCFVVQLWWEMLSWVSTVVSMNRMRESEKEKAREDREVGSCTRCNMGLAKEI